MPKGQVKTQVDINSASVEELSKLNGLNRKKAQALVDYRNKNGAFESWDDLEDVEGFSNSLIQNMRTGGATLGEMEQGEEGEEW